MKHSAAQNETFMVVAFTDELITPQSIQARFRVWPAHVPLVPPLRGYRLQATQRMEDFLETNKIGPVFMRVISRTAFGEENGMPVSLLDANDESKGKLNYLGNRLADAALRNGTVLANDRVSEYTPHIVESSVSPLPEVGQEISISTLSVVSFHSEQGWKQVTKTIQL